MFRIMYREMKDSDKEKENGKMVSIFRKWIFILGYLVKEKQRKLTLCFSWTIEGEIINMGFFRFA